MISRQLLFNAWQSLRQHKFRSALSIIGIVFAVTALIAMLAIGEGAKRKTLEQIRQLGTNSIVIRQLPMTVEDQTASFRYGSRGLEKKDIRSLRSSISYLSCISALKEVRTDVYSTFKENAIEIIALTSSYQKIKNLETDQGRFLCESDEHQKNLVCVLGAEVAQLLGPKSHIGHTLRIENDLYRIVGILKRRTRAGKDIQALAGRDFNRSVLIPMSTESGAGFVSDEFGEISEIIIQLKHEEHVPASAKLTKRILTNNHGGIEDFQVIVPRELIYQAQRSQHVFNLVLGSIAAISLLVGGIGIMNIMLSSVAERTREIGIRRAIGASQMHIVIHFLCEAVILTLIGSLAGILTGALFASLISILAKWPTVITMWSIILSLFMAVCVSIVSGLYPAIKGAMLDPVVALRHN